MGKGKGSVKKLGKCKGQSHSQFYDGDFDDAFPSFSGDVFNFAMELSKSSRQTFANVFKVSYKFKEKNVHTNVLRPVFLDVAFIYGKMYKAYVTMDYEEIDTIYKTFVKMKCIIENLAKKGVYVDGYDPRSGEKYIPFHIANRKLQDKFPGVQFDFDKQFFRFEGLPILTQELVSDIEYFMSCYRVFTRIYTDAITNNEDVVNPPKFENFVFEPIESNEVINCLRENLMLGNGTVIEGGKVVNERVDMNGDLVISDKLFI